jgi:hypothetical protein
MASHYTDYAIPVLHCSVHNKTANVLTTFRHVHATTVSVEKQKELHILSVYSFTYPAYNAHVPYCHLCPVQVYNIFPHYLINGMIFKKIIAYKMCALILFTTFV